MIAPWAAAAWFLVRAVATSGSGKVGLLDDLGIASAFVAVAIYAFLIA